MKKVKNRKTIILLSIFCFLFAIGNAVAEHPEHPAKGAEEKKAGMSKEAVEVAIKKYVEAESKDGYFSVNDEKAKKTLKLKLDRVHREKISKVSENLYFVCADFKTDKGKVYDLDFFIQDIGKDNIKVTEISIHKEVGEPRYTWQECKMCGGIWFKEGKGFKKHEHSSGHPSEHPSSEHPK